MLIGGVIDDELDHHLHLAVMGGRKECSEIVERAINRMNVHIVGDVVPVVSERRGKERQQPEAGNAQILQIIELLQSGLENRRCRRRYCR